MAGYKTLGVPEVWFLKAGDLPIYGLQDGEYSLLGQSHVLSGLDIALLTTCLAMPDEYDAITAFRAGI